MWLIWLFQMIVSKWRNQEINKDWLRLHLMYTVYLWQGFFFWRPMCNIPNAYDERCASHIALQLHVIAYATCDIPSSLAAAFQRILGVVDSTSSFSIHSVRSSEVGKQCVSIRGSIPMSTADARDAEIWKSRLLDRRWNKEVGECDE